MNFLKIKRVALQKSDDILEAPDANTNVVSHSDDGLVVWNDLNNAPIVGSLNVVLQSAIKSKSYQSADVVTYDELIPGEVYVWERDLELYFGDVVHIKQI